MTSKTPTRGKSAGKGGDRGKSSTARSRAATKGKSAGKGGARGKSSTAR